jgi:dTDP-4-dehydrorhamnose reductase
MRNLGKKMKILITGASGYIASNLSEHLRNAGCEVFTMSRKERNESGHYTSDLSDILKIAGILEESKPDVIIHTVWINSIAKCEQNEELARTVNVEWSHNLVKAIETVDLGIKLAFISSDYVFDGSGGYYNEQDQVNPLTYYGKTKVRVEELIQESGLKHIICRTANVFHHRGKFFNFLYENILHEKSIDVFYDTFFTPTYMSYFLDSIYHLIIKDFEGIIHLSGMERVSRYEFAVMLAQAMGKDERLVVPVKKPEEIKISYDSSLDSSYFREMVGNFSPTFEKSLQYALGRLVYPYFSHFDLRGGICGINQGQTWKEINYIESAKGAVRGNHYHKETLEGFFIIDGTIRIDLHRLENDKKESFIVRRGDILMIEPNVVHTFIILEAAKWINFLSRSIEGSNKDFHRIELNH